MEELRQKSVEIEKEMETEKQRHYVRLSALNSDIEEKNLILRELRDQEMHLQETYGSSI